MNKSNGITKTSVKGVESNIFKISRMQNGYLKKNSSLEVSPKLNRSGKWINRSNDDELPKMTNGKWSSQISNDSAFCSTEAGFLEASTQFDNDSIRDDHQLSNLSLDQDGTNFSGHLDDNGTESNFSIDVTKSNEELSQCRLSIDGSSCASLPNNLYDSTLSVCGSSPKKTSAENIRNLQKKGVFKRSTSFEVQETESTQINFRQKLKNVTKRSQHFIKEQTAAKFDSLTSSYSVPTQELDQYEIWTPKSFLDGKDLDFQILPANPFLKLRLLSNVPVSGRSDLKVAIIKPLRSEAPESVASSYQKCLMRCRVQTTQPKSKQLFLFESIVIIAKQRSQTFRIKERINLLLFWMSCDQPNNSKELLHAQIPVTFGKCQGHIKHSSITFNSLQDKLSWIRAVERQQDLLAKSQTEVLVIKVLCEDKIHGNRTKKLSVGRKETVADVLNRVPMEFFPITDSESQFQFSIKFLGESERYLLSGIERLYSIQLASNNNWMNNEIEYFSIAHTKKRSSLKKNYSWKRSKKPYLSEISPSQLNHCTSEAKSIFGRDLPEIFRENGGEPPKALMDLMKHLYKHGPHTHGIFRKNSSQKELQTALDVLDGQEPKEFLEQIKMCTASSLLKMWLGKMPDSLLIGENYFKWLEAAEIQDEKKRIQEIKVQVDQLPRENHLLLRHLVCILRRVADNSKVNEMNPHNLAVCVGPSVLKPASAVDNEKEADSRKTANVVIETMISHAEEIFGGECLIILHEEQSQDESNFREHDSIELLTSLESCELPDADEFSPDCSMNRSQSVECETTPDNLDLERSESTDLTDADDLRPQQPDVQTNDDDSEIVRLNQPDTDNGNLVRAGSMHEQKEIRKDVHDSMESNEAEIHEQVDSYKSYCQMFPECPPKTATSLLRHSSFPAKDNCSNFGRSPAPLRIIPMRVQNKERKHRKHNTVPLNLEHWQGCLQEKKNSEKPRYVVEVFLDSHDSSRIHNSSPSQNKPQLRRESQPKDPRRLPAVQWHDTPLRPRYKTTIYLGPSNSSCIAEPFNTSASSYSISVGQQDKWTYGAQDRRRKCQTQVFQGFNPPNDQGNYPPVASRDTHHTNFLRF